MASKNTSNLAPSTDPSFLNTHDGQHGPPSIISSRMTDIASEDGDDQARASASRTPPNIARQSIQSTSDGRSRPGTSTTQVSSQRNPWTQAPPSRAGQRGSMQGSTIGLSSGRPNAATSRTHVPSLQSHAFFRPMSSQRLQQQRGGSRPVTVTQATSEDGSAEGVNGTPRQSVQSNQTAKLESSPTDNGILPPPSRGTEMTEQETVERVTANTSPTHGHYPTGSLTESVRPLQSTPQNIKGLSVNIDKSYKNGGLPTPSKSPRSFRSSFLLPAKVEGGPTSPKRSTQGREKLESGSSSPAIPQATSQKVPLKKEVRDMGKNHQYFEGNTRFWFGGRFQNARDRPINIATGFLVLIPGVLFFAFSAPWLWHNISPAIPIVFAYIFYICSSSFLHASVSDPGILPRNLQKMPPRPSPSTEDLLAIPPSTTDWLLVKSASSDTAAMEMPIKYCKTCNIWRPPRGHHCRVCDNCIEIHDHHCVWLNNCVGRRNYRYFFAFVTSATLMGLYLLGASLTQILVYRSRESCAFGEAIAKFRVSFAMCIYALLAFPYPMALMGYHIFLMARGETTREYLNSHKFIRSERHRAFTMGSIVMNWIVVLCRPRPPSYLGFKREYVEGNQRLGERRVKVAKGGAKDGVEMQKLGGVDGPAGRS